MMHLKLTHCMNGQLIERSQCLKLILDHSELEVEEHEQRP